MARPGRPAKCRDTAHGVCGGIQCTGGQSTPMPAGPERLSPPPHAEALQYWGTGWMAIHLVFSVLPVIRSYPKVWCSDGSVSKIKHDLECSTWKNKALNSTRCAPQRYYYHPQCPRARDFRIRELPWNLSNLHAQLKQRNSTE